jgi:hypothetical protein
MTMRLFEELEAVEDAEADHVGELHDDIRRLRSSLGLPVPDSLVQSFAANADEYAGWYLTSEEDERYERAAARVKAVGDATRAYLQRHGETYGGSWLSHSGTGEYHVVFTADVERHRDTLRGVVPHPDVLHVHSGRFTERELESILDQLFDDEGLAEAGVEMLGGGVDVQLNCVLAVVVAPDRETAEAAFRDRYGEAVQVDWEGIEPFTIDAVPWQLYACDGGRELTVHYLSGGPDRPFERTELEEDGATVRVTVHERFPRGANLGSASVRAATVKLAQPLGARKVVDGATGRARRALAA